MRWLLNSTRVFAPEGEGGATPGEGAQGATPTQDGAVGIGSGDGKAESGSAPDKVNGQAPWYGEIDESLRPVAERFTSASDAFRAIQDLRRRESRVRVPDRNATPAEITAYRQATGVPDTAEGYEFPKVDDADMTPELKESRAGWAKFFHEQGVSKSTASKLMERYFAEEKARLEREKELDDEFAEQTITTLDKEWGSEKARNMEYSNRAFNAIAERAGLDPNELRHVELKGGRFLMDTPFMAKMFAVMGRAMGEGDLGGLVGQEERSTVQEQVANIRKEITKAQEEKDSARADRLYAQEQELLSRLGNRPAVGAGGRVA